MIPGRTSQIGPYRLEDRLGAGGMGEVWRAWDERLDRSVAVKLIRPESAEDQTTRERFRREARAAAALTHPAIVRIYDVVESGEGEAIVMELVEGELLAKRIARGPLPVEEAVRLGRQIAEGLAAAHRRGILHRDLKAENVIVTPEGEAKILDFGLAKRLEGETEGSLTHSAAVVGTFRSMSPEQARGMTLDHRSDLFSFGVLLYEMLTGVSPFKGESAPDTLMRICTARQVPVRELRPEVPRELSSLIDHFLEKDPVFRPRSAQEALLELQTLGETENRSPSEERTLVASREPVGRTEDVPGKRASSRRIWMWGAPIVLLLLAGSWWFFRSRSTAPRLYVAVLKPQVQQGSRSSEADLMAAGLRVTLLRTLLLIRGISLLAPEQVDAVPGGMAAVARAISADELLSSKVDCSPLTCQIVLQRLQGSDGSLIWTQILQVPTDRPYLLSEAVPLHLVPAYSGRGVRSELGNLSVREEDYTEYLRLRSRFDSSREQEIPVSFLLNRLGRVRSSSPRFVEAHILEAEILHYRFRSGRDPADLRHASELLQRASVIAPDDPRPFEGLFEGALLGEQLDEAAAILRELERLQPGDAGVLARRARLFERQGQPEQALALIRQVIALHPSWKNLAWAAEMEFRLGEIQDARLHLEQLQSRFPGYYVGRSLLAQIELFYGEPSKAAVIYEGLVRRRPQYDELTNLGLAYFLLGRFQEAEAIYRRALEMQPRNPLALLNLADVTLLLGREKGARDLYRQVLERIGEDATSATQWQMMTLKGQALAHLGRPEEAVAAAQEALRLAPMNPQVAYEVSLVYVLVGDLTSAFLNAERAIEEGVGPRWFSLPWFAPLHDSLRFKAVLTRKSS